MELNWSTFALEIFNFLILVWILTRFLYRPILNTIAQRKQAIQQQWQQAADKQQQAEQLKRQYENRLADWEQEKNAARKHLHDDIEAERKRLFDELRADIEAEKEKQAAIAQHHIDDQLKKNQRRALQQGAAFAAKLLTRLSTPALQQRIVDVLFEDIKNLSSTAVAALQTALKNTQTSIAVVSAFPLAPDVQAQVTNAMAQLAGRSMVCDFSEDSQLIAGIAISVGSWRVQANIQDELRYFAEVGNDQL